MSAHAPASQPVSTPDALPLFYGMLLNSPCAVEGWEPGTPLAFTRLEQPDGGDVVALYIKGQSPVLMKLLTGLLPEDWLSLPDYRIAASSDVSATVVGTVLGTEKCVSVPLERVAAIHKCVGSIDQLEAEAAR